MKKVFIALPAFGQNNSSFTTASLVATTRFLAERGQFGGFAQMSYPDLEDLRAMFLSIWFDQIDASHILFVDADMQFEPQLVLDMIDFDKPLVGCLYPKRTLPISWVGSGLEGERVRDGGFLKVEGIGFGVTLISRACVQNMIACSQVEIDMDLDRHTAGATLKSQGVSRMIRAFDKIDLPRRALSEDYSFCLRHRRAGGDVWAATHHRVTHVGTYGFGGRFDEVVSQPAPAGPRTKACKHGTFTYNPNDTFIGASLDEYGEWCEFELDRLLPMIRAGDTVIDAGANIGTHTVPFAKAVGPTGMVLFFEPQPRIFKTLTANILVNRIERAHGSQTILSDDDSLDVAIADLPPDETRFNFGAVAAIGKGGATVRPMTIDSMNLPSCRLIKVDVEGMEAQVIRGARETIARCKPFLYIENNGDDSKAIWPVLEQIGYRAFWSIGTHFNPDNHFGSKRNLWPNVMPSVNLIAATKDMEPDDYAAGLPPLKGPDQSWRDVIAGRLLHGGIQ